MSNPERVMKAAAVKRQAKTKKQIQAKLTIGAVDDPMETEAEATADRVISSIQAGPTSGPAAQRFGEEEELQGSRTAQRMEEEELQMSPAAQRMEEEELQMSPAAKRVQKKEVPKGSQLDQASTGPNGGPVSPELEAELVENTGGEPLPEPVKSTMEQSFSHDFSDVTIHRDSEAAVNIGALAYTQGSDIHFAPGQFDPKSDNGLHLLSHELTHVVQQGG